MVQENLEIVVGKVDTATEINIVDTKDIVEILVCYITVIEPNLLYL